MSIRHEDIQIISAPSILGLKPSGVEWLSKSLLDAELAKLLKTNNETIHVDTINEEYNTQRDYNTKILNARAIKGFSLTLGPVVLDTIEKKKFPVVLVGDCSILIGIMALLKSKGPYGLFFLDAHADFYQPEKSTTGEVADMDLAIITGRGPEILTNINHQQPYVKDDHVVHIGQRDQKEAQSYGSQDIRETQIKCVGLDEIRKLGIIASTNNILQSVSKTEAEGFWIHYDTDVLSDDINPAVDYRLPGGLQFEEVEFLIRELLRSVKIMGISVTIFNPMLDKKASVSHNIAASLGRAFDLR